MNEKEEGRRALHEHHRVQDKRRRYKRKRLMWMYGKGAAFPRAVLGAEEEKEKRGGERRLKREWVVMDPIRAMELPRAHQQPRNLASKNPAKCPNLLGEDG